MTEDKPIENVNDTGSVTFVEEEFVTAAVSYMRYLLALRKAVGRDIKVELLVKLDNVMLSALETEEGAQPDSPVTDFHTNRFVAFKNEGRQDYVG
jgi:hypothetical protein